MHKGFRVFLSKDSVDMVRRVRAKEATSFSKALEILIDIGGAVYQESEKLSWGCGNSMGRWGGEEIAGGKTHLHKN